MKSILHRDTHRFTIDVKVSPDNLKAFLDLVPQGGRHDITRDEIFEIVKLAIPVDHIDLGVIDDMRAIAKRGEPALERRIIKGVEPEKGTDGKLLLLVKKYTGHGEPTVDKSGRVSLTDLHLFDNIIKGQVVGRLYPPKPGKDGRDVFGKPIPAKAGEPAKVTVDPTLKIEPHEEGGEKYDRIVSQAEGYLADESGTLAVREELTIKGDVDFHVGNIDFIGKAVVQGDIQPGFSVSAIKGIVVQGGVRQAKLLSAKGDIEIRGFVFGGEGSSIVAGGAIKASVIQQARVEAAGAITILKEAIDSELRSEQFVTASAGHLVGGKTMTVCGVEAKELGNSAGKGTEIVLCNSVEISTEFGKLLVNIDNHDKAIKLIELHLGPLAANPSRVNFLNAPHKEKMVALVEKMARVKESRTKLLEKKKELLESGRISQIARVNISQMAYPGVKITSGEDVFLLQEAIKGPASIEYNPTEKKFISGELKPLDCQLSEQSKKPPVIEKK